MSTFYEAIISSIKEKDEREREKERKRRKKGVEERDRDGFPRPQGRPLVERGPSHLAWRCHPNRISLGCECKHLLPATPLVSPGDPAHLQGHPQGCRALSTEATLPDRLKMKTGEGERHLGCRRADHLPDGVQVTLRGRRGGGTFITVTMLSLQSKWREGRRGALAGLR